MGDLKEMFVVLGGFFGGFFYYVLGRCTLLLDSLISGGNASLSSIRRLEMPASIVLL